MHFVSNECMGLSALKPYEITNYHLANFFKI